MASVQHRELAAAAVLAVILGATPALGGDAPLPPWVRALIAKQTSHTRDVVEEATYNGKRVFEVLPGDRAPDSGYEHVLYSEGGSMICTFGGFAGHVTAGSCEIGKITYQRTLYPRRPR